MESTFLLKGMGATDNERFGTTDIDSLSKAKTKTELLHLYSSHNLHIIRNIMIFLFVLCDLDVIWGLLAY